jgi:uncharacterized membrane protein
MTWAWVFIAIIGYFFNAIVVLVDKFLLTKKIKDPWTYAFYAGVLGGLSLFLWPFVFSFLIWPVMITALFSGIAFFWGIFYLYKAMSSGEATRVVSIIGGVSPLVVLGASYYFLHERLPAFWYLAFLFLISGAILLSLERRAILGIGIGKDFPKFSFFAAVFFAFSFFFAKVVYMNAGFLNGFIWMRVGTLMIPVFLLLFSDFRKKVFKKSLVSSRRVPLFFISNKTLSAVAFFLLSYAISLGSVAVVNALQGVQYAFIFVLAVLSYFYNPKILEESFSFEAIAQKVFGIFLVSAGVVLLFLV